MTYFGEFRLHWPTLIGSAFGLALGSALNHYMSNLFAPELIEVFGWDKSQLALIGVLGLVSMVIVPFAGRFTDRFGARLAATIGFTLVALTYLAYSFMTGPIWQFFAITAVHNIFGVLTTTLVFNRVIVERFDLARGMALSILMTGAPLAGAVVVPMIGEVIEAEGWRVGYRVMAMLTVLGGALAIWLVGRRNPATAAEGGHSERSSSVSRAEIMAFLRNPAFVLIIAGMFFCNFPQIIVSSQLKLVLMESGATSQIATWIVSLYATGVIAGRFASGLALDKVSPQTVAIFALGLPAIGFLALASSFDATWILGGSVLLMGLAQGAEGDIGAYLTSRTFDMRNFSLIYSFLIASMGLANAIGSVALSMTLGATGNFAVFLILAAALTIVGALCFWFTGRGKPPEAEPAASDLALNP